MSAFYVLRLDRGIFLGSIWSTIADGRPGAMTVAEAQIQAALRLIDTDKDESRFAGMLLLVKCVDADQFKSQVDRIFEVFKKQDLFLKRLLKSGTGSCLF